MKKVVSPFPYQGGKHKEIPRLELIMPRNLAVCDPFFGSGTVTNYFGKNDACIAVEKLKEVYFIWKYFKDNNTKFLELIVEYCSDDNKNEEYYYNKRDIYNKYLNRDTWNEDRIATFYYLICTCHAAMIRYGPNGFNTPFFQTGDHFRLYNIWQKINCGKNTAKRLKSVHNECALQFLKNDIGNIDVIYCDPPYVGASSIYQGDWTNENYQELIDVLKFQWTKFGIPSITSNYISEFFDSQYDSVTRFKVIRNANADKLSSNGSIMNIIGTIGTLPRRFTLENFYDY